MKNVLVTGGTGSFGQAFVERLLTDENIKRIAVYSRGEHAQEEMARRFTDQRMRFFIGDVRDRDRLEMAMRTVDTVVHAAALKIVPIAEYNPTECISTNVGGAENVVKAALRSRVSRVIALSTDKAVNPVNLYGASKLAAEKIFVAANALAAGSCAFNVVRYGNVVGSRGSVIPLFKKLAKEGKPLPVTDERMTRFWITLDQAIRLVIQAALNWSGGIILIPKIPSMKIIDLASVIGENKPWTVTGIRPGEKLHEVLLTEDEARTSSELPYCYVIHPNPIREPLAEGFRYTSDTNKHWLTKQQLRELL